MLLDGPVGVTDGRSDHRPASVTVIVTKTSRNELDMVRRDRTSETAPRFGRGHLQCLVTGWTGWDGDRLAHNPEVEGSNPAPATKARGSFSNRERAFCLWFANGHVKSRSFLLPDAVLEQGS